MRPSLWSFRRVRFLAAGAALVAVSASTLPASAQGFKKESSEEHGSQVASSEWLPIMIGASAGVVVGGLTGVAFDTAQPAVVGPVAGGVIGGITGGAGGAWLIRSIREKDTRLAGTITGAGIGTGVGVLLFAKTNAEGRPLETIGKFGALAILPVVGGVIGHRLAIAFGSKTEKEAPPEAVPLAVAPSVAPLVGPNGTHGMAFGFDGSF